MAKNSKHNHGAMGILTELALEGTSSFVEAQRTLLSLAQQENEIVLNGVKQQVAAFQPAVAITDLVRRSLDTFIGMQQDFLTIGSKQALHILEAGNGRSDFLALAFEFAREEMDAFIHAHKKLLDVFSEETANVTSGQGDHKAPPVKKDEWAKAARGAAEAFLEAQKNLLDIVGQQMNVNLDAAAQAADFLSPSKFLPMAVSAGDRVKSFVNAETAMVGSIFKPSKRAKVVNIGKKRQSYKRIEHRAA